MNFKKVFLVIIGTHLLEILVFVLVWYGLMWQARLAVASNIGMKNNPGGLESYITGNFVQGISRKEILSMADKINSFKVKPFYLSNEYCETFTFYGGPFAMQVGEPWVVCYDKDWDVTSVTSGGRQ